jgi:hypothetical protein
LKIRQLKCQQIAGFLLELAKIEIRAQKKRPLKAPIDSKDFKGNPSRFNILAVMSRENHLFPRT